LSGTFVKMGVYLSTPKTEKLSEDGENDKLKFGLSSMQGWRATMEDAVSFYPLFLNVAYHFRISRFHYSMDTSRMLGKCKLQCLYNG
jgi:hypothetical protein